MKRIYTWLLSYKRWIVLMAVGASLLAALFAGAWLLWSLRVAMLIGFVLTWLVRIALGIGAGWAALRLWPSRHNPLIRWLGLYIHGFIVEVVTAIILLFLARGVTLTWKFSTVMFVSALVSDVIRAPLIIYLIRGPSALSLPEEAERSGEKPPEYWLEAFRTIVREEVRRVTKVSSSSRRQPPRK